VRELNGHNFNYRPTSHLLPMKRVYGVIVKFRKKAKAVSLETKDQGEWEHPLNPICTFFLSFFFL
jgi:hypothetical protein